jgi:hypothetical protein
MINDDNDLVDETSAPVRRNAKRPSIAPAMRANTVRTDKVRRRKRGSKGEDYFYIPDDLRVQLDKRGLSCEFKRISYFGKEEDPDYHIGLAENAWEPLSLKSFPDFKKLMPANWTKDTFEKRGQILMVRPASLTAEARAEDEFEANNQVKGQLQSLKDSKPGEAERTLVKVKRNYEGGVPVE